MREMTLDEVHDVLYDILVDIHEFCVENDIKYSLAGGTLLGAIRHNGFIPWDDDIDVQMSRPEYERFIHSYKSKNGYLLFSRELPGCEDVEVAFTRVCDMNQTFVDTSLRPWKNGPTGLWVDVVPIDGAPNSKIRANIKISIMYVLWKLSITNRYPKNFTIKSTHGYVKKFKHVLKKYIVVPIIPKNFICYYIALCKEYNYCDNNYIANYSTMQNKFREWQPKRTMESFVLHQFGKGKFYIMEDYNTSLSHLYGDYMKLPPVDKQVAHIDNSYFWK